MGFNIVLRYRVACDSPSIVTMAVSVAVCEIFSVKEWCDLENSLTGLGFVKCHAVVDRLTHGSTTTAVSPTQLPETGTTRVTLGVQRHRVEASAARLPQTGHSEA